MLRIDEAVLVATDNVGEPVGFSWRGCTYRVGSRPIRWFTRRAWWLDSPRANRGFGASLLEIEMWRIEAFANQEARQFELTHSVDDDAWRLVRVFE